MMCTIDKGPIVVIYRAAKGKKLKIFLPMFSSSSINLNQILDVGDADGRCCCCAEASFPRMSLLEGTLLSFICRLKSLSHSIVSFDDS